MIARKGQQMKKIYICSPLRGDYTRNQQRAKQHCREALRAGYIPIAPHIYFTEFLSDNIPEERQQGMTAGLELLQLCQELWAYIPSGSFPSEGMQQEIRYAIDKGIEVKFIYE